MENLKNKQVFIARRAQIAGTETFLATTVTSAFMHIQPLSDDEVELIEGVYGKAFVLYCDGAVDVQEGDKLRDEDNNYYEVRAGGVSRRDFGSFDHRKIVAEKL